MPRLLPGGHCLPSIKEDVSLRSGTKWLCHLTAGLWDVPSGAGSPPVLRALGGMCAGCCVPRELGSARAVLWGRRGRAGTWSYPGEECVLGWSQPGCWGCVLPRALMSSWLGLQPLFHMEIVNSTVNWGQQEGLASPSAVWVLFAPSL